jgi:predicted porin
MFNLGEISMKKSLVALAVLASAGGAFAQSSVTLSGSYAFGFAQNKKDTTTSATVPTTTAKASGFGTDTASIKLAAVEDLGGGLKLSASITAANLSRGSAVGGEDARLDLSGGFGKLSMGTVESGTGIRPLSQVDAPVFNFEGEVFAAAENIDAISYQSASFSGFSFGVAYVDRGVAPAPNSTGLGEGTTGLAGKQPSITLNAVYSNGPVNAKIDTTIWTRQNSTDIPATANNSKSRVRLSGNYDLGVVKLGAGYSTFTRTNSGPKTNEFGFGISAPLGPVTVGAYYASQKTTDVNKKDGFTLGASYALSKRTSISSNIATWTVKNTPVAPAASFTSEKGNHFELLMNHNF